ncbi:MAG: sugar phosphate nucleotidyltransferase [candidate division Zixibacteria bacterium]|nr:sugar phosphate nucleotidyltransferase [candidate division Zixibacteria bacterium]
MRKLAVIILAAGKGKRMKSDLPKVLHKIAGRPLIDYVISTAREINPQRIIVVIGHKYQMVKEHLKDSDLGFVIQKEQLGTGHAVMQTENTLSDFDGTIVVLCGDVPFLKAETIEKLIQEHHKARASATVLTTILDNPKGYGRIKRDGNNLVEKIVEEIDTTIEEKKLKEINSGIFCFESKLLFETLHQVDTNNKQREYYLTDVLKLMRDKNLPVAAVVCSCAFEVSGVNSIEQLKQMEKASNFRVK